MLSSHRLNEVASLTSLEMTKNFTRYIISVFLTCNKRNSGFSILMKVSG